MTNEFMEFTVKHPDTVCFCGAYLALIVWGILFLFSMRKYKK